MKKCEFCNALKFQESIKYGNISHKYSIALVCESYVNGEYRGRNTLYQHKLNYCPECGKKID